MAAKKGKGNLDLFIGIGLHNQRWHVTITTGDVELFGGSIPGQWVALHRILDRCQGPRIHAVYEAGYFGFWLYDQLMAYGCDCLVTPPSRVPKESGNRVKTDRRDSRKLAHLVAKGLLKKVWVPREEKRFHRQVILTEGISKISA
jgi:transposase